MAGLKLIPPIEDHSPAERVDIPVEIRQAADAIAQKAVKMHRQMGGTSALPHVLDNSLADLLSIAKEALILHERGIALRKPQ